MVFTVHCSKHDDSPFFSLPTTTTVERKRDGDIVYGFNDCNMIGSEHKVIVTHGCKCEKNGTFYYRNSTGILEQDLACWSTVDNSKIRLCLG